MDRSHLYLPLVDSSGNPYPYADVTLLDSTTGLPISAPVYLGPLDTAPQSWPVLITNPVVVDLWTDTPMRVTLLAALPGGTSLTMVGVDIVPPPTETVQSDHPVLIGSTTGLDGSAILSISPTGTASWGVVNALQYHRHKGDSQDSTMVGMTNYTDIYPRQVWVGSAPGAPSGQQGTDTIAIGATAAVLGTAAVAIGNGSAADSAVAIGSSTVAGSSSAALGSGALAAGVSQVSIGEGASASAGATGAVAVGAADSAAAASAVTVSDAVQVMADGSITIGRGTMPSLSGLNGTTFVTVLGECVLPSYLRADGDVSLAGPASPLGLYGSAGSTRPILSSSGVTGGTPGQAALLSLLSALDQLGLVYDTDGAIDDDLADWTKADTHDANSSLDTGDTSGFYAGDTTRFKRAAAGVSAITYHKAPADIRDFTARVFSDAPVDIATEVLAWLSPDGATWTPVTLAWQTLVTTVSPWVQTWCSNARPVPAGMRYLKLQLGANAVVAAPQIGRVLIR